MQKQNVRFLLHYTLRVKYPHAPLLSDPWGQNPSLKLQLCISDFNEM